MSPQGSRRRAVGGAGAGVVDRLSGLPEELLLQILGSLGSTYEAVRTGVLSRRWRGLWTALRELVFAGVEDSGVIEAALAQVARRPALDVVDVTLVDEAQRQHLSSLLRARPISSPSLPGNAQTTGGGAVNLPCLDRTDSLAITMCETPLTPPPSGEFVALQILALHWCSVGTNALLPLCPCLRVLVMENCIGDFGNEAVILSPSLEELVLTDSCLERIDIVAPLLKKVKVKVYLLEPVTVSLSTPEVKHSKWRFIVNYSYVYVTFGLWRLVSVCQRAVGEHLARVNIQLTAYSDTLDQDWDFARMIAQLPAVNFSALDLDIQADGHVFGPLLLHLLRIQPAIQRLNMFMKQPEEEVACRVNCPCDQSGIDWRSESVGFDQS